MEVFCYFSLKIHYNYIKYKMTNIKIVVKGIKNISRPLKL